MDGLHEVKPGLYGFQEYSPTDKILLAVHPYFDARSTHYVERLEHLISKFKGPIIALEDNNIRETAERFVAIGGKRNKYFVRTEPADTDLIGTDWQELFGLLGKSHVFLVGGYFDDHDRRAGCLGDVADKLDIAHIRFTIRKDAVYRF